MQAVLLDTSISAPIPIQFDWDNYIESEREYWVFLPDLEQFHGRRIYLTIQGMTAQVFVEKEDDGSRLGMDEAYFLLPCANRSVRQVRMQCILHLDRESARLVYPTFKKLNKMYAGILPTFQSFYNAL